MEKGATTYEAADKYEIGVATVGRWMREWRKSGEMGPGKRGNPSGQSLIPMRHICWACLKIDAI